MPPETTPTKFLTAEEQGTTKFVPKEILSDLLLPEALEWFVKILQIENPEERINRYEEHFNRFCAVRALLLTEFEDAKRIAEARKQVADANLSEAQRILRLIERRKELGFFGQPLPPGFEPPSSPNS